ncbi:MAG: GNAT family N-acetyltransferase [Bacteroidales bacterium]
MLRIEKINKESDFPRGLTREEYVDFLHQHLDRFGDSKEAINKCIDYAFSENPMAGGFLLAAYDDDRLVGALVMNRTGMEGYIPGWVLVYVAVDAECRGKGYGRQIVERSFEYCDGDVKLHVEYDNPAKRLYERIGFTTRYAEMRYKNTR